MRGESLAENVARCLAEPSGRRPVFVALAAGLAGLLLGQGPAAAEGRSRRKDGCRRDRDCGDGQACVRRRCRTGAGIATIDHECAVDADCSTASGPAVCVATATICACGGTPTAAPGEGGQLECPGAARRCRGSFVAATGHAASCATDCECAGDLTCQGGFCAPGPTG